MAKKLSLEELKQKRNALEARIRAEEAKKRVKSRKIENRRKVLAGAAVLYHADKNPVFQAELVKILDGFLTRPDERAVFDLPPKVGA